MAQTTPARTTTRGGAAAAPPATGITIYGCGREQAALFRAMAPRFGVVPTIVEAPACEANVGVATGSLCVSVGHEHEVTNRTLLALGRAGVRYVSTRSVGCDHIDVACAERVGISVGTVAYSPDSVADYAVMLMLMAARDAKAMLRRADAHDYRLGDRRGRELRDLTVGVVGTGRIGSAVIQRLQGFGCRLLAHDARPTAAATYVSLDELLRRSDLVTLHTPLTADTHHLLSRERIARMKPGALVVNTARGSLLDTEALLEGLESGRLGGAALDVLEGEQGVFYADCGSGPGVGAALAGLQRLPNAIVSPHIAYDTDRALRDIVEASLVNCASFAGAAAQHG